MFQAQQFFPGQNFFLSYFVFFHHFRRVGKIQNFPPKNVPTKISCCALTARAHCATPTVKVALVRLLLFSIVFHAVLDIKI